MLSTRDHRNAIHRLLRLAYEEALKSPEPSTQTGALLATPLGTPLKATLAHNDFPSGVAMTTGRLKRPTKYRYVVHAERQALYAAARKMVPTEGTVMFSTWAACCDCAKAIIQCGCSAMVALKPPADGAQTRWSDDIDVALGMLTEAGVQTSFIDPGDLFHDLPPIRRDGELVRLTTTAGIHVV